MLKTAVIGASGFIGRHLLAAHRESHPDTVGTSFSTHAPTLLPFDLRRPDLAALRLEETGHQAVLIASAKPNVAYCENNRADAYAVNVAGTLELARQVGKTSLRLIFLSSDYVFDGQSGGYDDAAPTSPTTEYGRQKAAVEKEIASLVDRPLVLRLSKIFGIEKGDRTLLDDIGASLAAGRVIRAAADQVFSPTWVGDLVRATLEVQSAGLHGVVNLCAPEPQSRYEVARRVAEAMGAEPRLVEAVSLHELPGMAGRPLNTSMKCTRIGTAFTPLEQSIRVVSSNWKLLTA